MSTPEPITETGSSLYHVEASDPEGRLVDRSGQSNQDLAQINRLMVALVELRRAEALLTEASTRYMKLNQTDMRALHLLIVSQNLGEVVTPGAIAAHLGISTASTTKLLDRLERGGHITREPHPTDRRALVIRITPGTLEAAMDTVGRQQARRFSAAARLTPAERDVVTRFLEDMTAELSLADVAWANADDA